MERSREGHKLFQNVARWENVARAVYIKSQIVSVKASNLSLSSPSIGALDRFG